jgi:hypothetical protein
LFGYGSHFHEEFGFFIDGVDETTARLPSGWQERCKVLEWEDQGIQIRAIAPAMNDLAVSKLHRLSEKDRDYIRACHGAGQLDLQAVRRLMATTEPDEQTRTAAFSFLDTLTGGGS